MLYPFELDDLVKGAVIALMTLAANHVFADSAAMRVGQQQESAFREGLNATPRQPTRRSLLAAGGCCLCCYSRWQLSRLSRRVPLHRPLFRPHQR